MKAVSDIIKKAKRIAAVGQILDTFDDPSERLDIIRGLVGSNTISEAAGDILFDEYAPGVAR